MAYKALKNTVSVSMAKQGKIKYGAQVGYNKHNNDPEARAKHNPNVNPELTQYNFNRIYLDGELDTSDMSDYDKFNRAFSHRANQRKKKDTMGRDIKVEGTNIARETIWYPPENLFDGCTTPKERAEKLQQFADDLLPFLQETFGTANIVEVSGHLDECKKYAGRPHLQVLSTNIICEGQEWEEKRKSRKKGASKDDKEVIQHSVGDVFGDTWFGGKVKCKRIKERYRQYLTDCGYDVKLEDMTEEERLSTGVLYTSETDERSFQAHLDAKQDVADRETAVTDRETAVQARETAADETEAAQKKRKSDLDEQETALQAREDDLTSREIQYQADLQTLVTGQQALREKQEQDEKDFQAREDKQEAQKRALDEQQKQLDELREQYFTPPDADEKVPPFRGKQIVRDKNKQIAYLQGQLDRKQRSDADLQAASEARTAAERQSAEATANNTAAQQELQKAKALKAKYERLIEQQEQKIQQEVEKRVPDAAAKKYNFDAAVMRDFIARDPKRQEVYNRYHAHRVEQRQNSIRQMSQDISQQMQDDTQYD